MDYIQQDIKRNRNRLQQLFDSYNLDSPSFDYSDGSKLLLMGDDFTLHYIDTEEYIWFLNVDMHILCVSKAHQSQIVEVLKDFYSSQAEYLRSRCRTLASEHGIKVNRIALRWTHSKWGSCSTLGNVNLCKFLILAPTAIQDYIILHELCHLIHMNHSSEFYALLGKMDPDYKLHRHWLKDRGKSLRIFPQNS
jgi:hypothetical protein